MKNTAWVGYDNTSSAEWSYFFAICRKIRKFQKGKEILNKFYSLAYMKKNLRLITFVSLIMTKNSADVFSRYFPSSWHLENIRKINLTATFTTMYLGGFQLFRTIWSTILKFKIIVIIFIQYSKIPYITVSRIKTIL